MKIDKMRKQTLLNTIAKCQMQVVDPHKMTVDNLRILVAKLVPTYIEDHFLRRVRSHLIPRNPGLKVPGHNKQYIVGLSGRMMEFDFSWRSIRLAVEIHGGLKNARSGHRTEQGVKRDMLKCNLAQKDGWTLLQLTTEEVMDNHTWNTHTVPLLEHFIKARLRPC